MNVDELTVRPVTPADLSRLAAFKCSTGASWEDVAEAEVRGPLPRRYLSVPPRFDGRMLLGCDRRGEILLVGAHHIEPTFVPDVAYRTGSARRWS